MRNLREKYDGLLQKIKLLVGRPLSFVGYRDFYLYDLLGAYLPLLCLLLSWDTFLSWLMRTIRITPSCPSGLTTTPCETIFKKYAKKGKLVLCNVE